MARPKKEEKIPMVRSSKIIYFMMGIITLFLVFLTIKVINLEKKIASGATGTAGLAPQQESPISVKNLKKYAKEMKLNTGKFNKCLDSGEKKSLVEKDTAYGTSVGIQGTPGFFINGKFLGGAFPFSAFKEIIDKELDGTSSTKCIDYTDSNLQQQCDETGTDPSKAFKPVSKQLDVSNTQAIGPKDAKVQLVEFSDFECPFCIRAYSTVRQILKDYNGQVRLYYKQFPLTQIHQNAQKAAEASLCAADQGKFWEYHDKLFSLEKTQ